MIKWTRAAKYPPSAIFPQSITFKRRYYRLYLPTGLINMRLVIRLRRDRHYRVCCDSFGVAWGRENVTTKLPIIQLPKGWREGDISEEKNCSNFCVWGFSPSEMKSSEVEKWGHSSVRKPWKSPSLEGVFFDCVWVSSKPYSRLASLTNQRFVNLAYH